MGAERRDATGRDGQTGRYAGTERGPLLWRAFRQATALFLAVLFVLPLPAGAWNVPGTSGDCVQRFGDPSSWTEAQKQCQFAANLEPDSVFVGGEKELGTGYYTHPHIYQMENAIRLFREKGWDNWALYLSSPDRFQALADGATWADAYKARLVIHFSIHVLFVEVYGWDYDVCNYAGFDHYYNAYATDPAGKGLDSEGIDILADALPALIKTLGPAIVEIAGSIAGVPGLGGLLTSFSADVRPTLQGEYPSAALQAQQHYDKAIAYYFGGMDPATGKRELYFPQRSQEYNSLFQLGWAAHLVQDMGVIYHIHDIMSSFPPNPHTDYEDDADGHGDPLDGVSADYHVTASTWTLGLDYANKKITELTRDEANAIDDYADWYQARSHDAAVRRPVVQKGSRISEQFTTAVLAKYLSETGIPKVKQPFQGRVEDMNNKPVPYAYVFYRKGLQCVQDPDTNAVCGTPAGAWNFVRADKNGVYVLDLKPSDASTIDTYLVRPVMPGYRYAGWQAGGAGELMGATLDGKPLEYKPPWKTEAVTVNPYYEFYLEPLAGEKQSGQMVTVLPVLLSLQPGALPGSTTDALREDLIAVTQESPLLRVHTTDAFQQKMLSLPETSYVEVEAANLVDLNMPRVLSSPSMIQSAVLSARDRKAAYYAVQKAEPAGAVPPTASVAGLAVKGEASPVLYAAPSTEEGWHAALALMPKTRVKAPDGTMVEVPDISGASGTAFAFSGDFLPANGIVRVPVKNAQIEVTLEPGPGAIGPGFTGLYAGTAQMKLPGTLTAAGGQGQPAIAWTPATPYGAAGAAAAGGDGTTGPLFSPGTQQPDPVKKSLILTTGSDGKAALMLRTGNQAGRIRLHFRVISNPDAPNVLAEDTVEFMVHPLINVPDPGAEMLPVIQAVQPRPKEAPAPAAGPATEPSHCFTIGPDRTATVVACPEKPLTVKVTDFISSVTSAIGTIPESVWPKAKIEPAPAGQQPCDDGNACTVMDRVVRGTCTGDAVICTPAGRCDPAAGCVYEAAEVTRGTLPVTPPVSARPVTAVSLAEGSRCDDGNACTAGDRIAGGTCRGEPFACNDGDDMTIDSCDPRTGCVFSRLGQVPESTVTTALPATTFTPRATIHILTTAAAPAPEPCPAGCSCLTRDEAKAEFGRYLPCSDAPCGSRETREGTVLRYCLRPAA